jgi:hypothetical protein
MSFSDFTTVRNFAANKRLIEQLIGKGKFIFLTLFNTIIGLAKGQGQKLWDISVQEAHSFATYIQVYSNPAVWYVKA